MTREEDRVRPEDVRQTEFVTSYLKWTVKGSLTDFGRMALSAVAGMSAFGAKPPSDTPSKMVYRQTYSGQPR